MIQDLEYLIKLQDIDLRIKAQELAKEQYPAAVKELEARISRAEAECVDTAAALEKLAGGLKEADETAAKMRESLARSQERLTSIKTNREYDAVHKEIEAQKSMLDSGENRKKNMEADIEKFSAAKETAAQELEKTKSELLPQIDDLKAKIGAIDSNIAEIMKERNEVSPHVSPQTLRIYDSIRKKRKNGKAVSIVGESKTCGVCYMVLQPHLLSEVRRGNKIILCESCGSILVIDQSAFPPAS